MGKEFYSQTGASQASFEEIYMCCPVMQNSDYHRAPGYASERKTGEAKSGKHHHPHKHYHHKNQAAQ